MLHEECDGSSPMKVSVSDAQGRVAVHNAHFLPLGVKTLVLMTWKAKAVSIAPPVHIEPRILRIACYKGMFGNVSWSRGQGDIALR